MATEKSLILFKPDAVEKNLVGPVLTRFQNEGFIIRGIKMIQLDNDILDEHYDHVSDLSFFPVIKAFMSRSPVVVLILEGENVIARVRELMGPTDSQKAKKGTIRGDYGESMMINVCHASDSPENADIEINRFFKPEEVFSF